MYASEAQDPESATLHMWDERRRKLYVYYNVYMTALDEINLASIYITKIIYILLF